MLSRFLEVDFIFWYIFFDFLSSGCITAYYRACAKKQKVKSRTEGVWGLNMISDELLSDCNVFYKYRKCSKCVTKYLRNALSILWFTHYAVLWKTTFSLTDSHPAMCLGDTFSFWFLLFYSEIFNHWKNVHIRW